MNYMNNADLTNLSFNSFQGVVKSMEVAWLRFWTCLLTGSLPPQKQTLLEKISKDIISTNDLNLSENQLQKFQVC